MNRILALVFALNLVFVSNLSAQEPVVPDPLKPWVDWVRSRDAEFFCTSLNNGKECLWPSALEITLEEKIGRFKLRGSRQSDGFVILPGSKEDLWPTEVRSSKSLAVIDQGGLPAVFISRGNFLIEGEFLWEVKPANLRVPNAAALVAVIEDGKALTVQRDITNSRISLLSEHSKRIDSEEQLQIRVSRKITDGHPFSMTLDLSISYSGPTKTIALKNIWPADGRLVESRSPLPQSKTPEGIEIALVPGNHSLRFEFKFPQVPTALDFPHPEGSGVIKNENWVFESNPSLRIVQLSGALPVSHEGLDLPDEWRHLPAYSVAPGIKPTLNELAQSSEESTPQSISLVRSLWLKPSEESMIVQDKFNGRLASTWRLNTGADLTLAEATLQGKRSLITLDPITQSQGIEFRDTNLSASVVGSQKWQGSRTSAIGWDIDVDSLQWNLHLPIGYKLIFAQGFELTKGAWVMTWTLLDVFLVIFLSVATWKVLGIMPAVAVFLLQFVGHQEAGIPFWSLLFALGLIAAIKRITSPNSTLRFFQFLIAAILVFGCYQFAVFQTRLAIYPELSAPQRVAPRQVPMPSSSKHRTVDSYQAPSEYTQTRSADAVDLLLIYFEGALGAMIIAGLVIFAVVLCFSRQWKRAGLFICAALGVFLLRSVSSAVFTKNYQAVSSGYESSARDMAENISDALMPQTLHATAPAGKSEQASQDFDAQSLGLIQTAPDTPYILGGTAVLSTSSSVTRAREVTLMLAPPIVVGFFRIFASMCFAYIVFVILITLKLVPRFPRQQPVAALVLLILALNYTNRASAQSFPSESLLQELKYELMKGACNDSCAAIESLEIREAPDRLVLDLSVVSHKASALRLPGNVSEISPFNIQVNGQTANAMRSDTYGFIWLQVPEGNSQVLVSLSLPASGRLAIRVPDRIGSIQNRLKEWQLDGIDDLGRVSSALEVSKLVASAINEPEIQRQEIPIEPWYLVKRTISIGARWRVLTHVERIGSTKGQRVARVPLQPGELLVDDQSRVQDGFVLVDIRDGETIGSFRSEIKAQGSIIFSAAKEFGVSEEWHISCSSEWRCTSSGISPISGNLRGQNTLSFLPKAGASLNFEVAALTPALGNPISVSNAQLNYSASLGELDGTLNLTIASSQAAPKELQLPSGSKLKSFTVNGSAIASVANSEVLSLPIAIGDHQYQLKWTIPTNNTRARVLPVPKFELPLNNLNVTYSPPSETWILRTSRAAIGPVVLFWPKLLVILIAAILLGRYKVAEVGIISWLLLGIGLATLDLASLIVPSLWLLATSWRKRNPPNTPALFTMVQIGWLLLTFVSFLVLIDVVRHGLLFSPAMQIVGNGSSANALSWYFESWSAEIGRGPGLISCSVWWWRGAMLLWSIWMSFFFLDRIRRGWEEFTKEGIVRKKSEDPVQAG